MEKFVGEFNIYIYIFPKFCLKPNDFVLLAELEKLHLYIKNFSSTQRRIKTRSEDI
jgi:hypothetical protein